MKQSITLPYIIFIILICLNIVLLLVIKKERKEYFSQKIQLQISSDSIFHMEKHIKMLQQSALLMQEYQLKQIDSTKLFLDEFNNKIFLNRLIKKSPLLIFKYSKLSCEICVVKEIEFLKEVSKRIGPENIIVITNYDSPRFLSQFVRINQVDFKVLNQLEENVGPFDDNIMFYFILDKTFTLKQLFIPVVGDTYLTSQYLNKIVEKHFQ